MLSFFILCFVYLVPCIYYFVSDIIRYNKINVKMIFSVILIVIAIYLKSVNL